VLDQLELQLEELEAEISENAVTTEEKTAGTAVKSFTRGRPVRAPLPAHLPRERVVIPAPCACSVCGGRLAKLGEDITETLEIVPRQWKGPAKRSPSHRHRSMPLPAPVLERAYWR